jgi:hypothetical protein
VAIVVDYGTTVSAARITLDVTRVALTGTVALAPTISVSNVSASGPWTDIPDLYQVFSALFRYTKYTLAATSSDGGIAQISSINARLDLKRKTEEWMVVCNAADSGGTTLDITGKFVQILSINITPEGTTPLSPVYTYDSAINPTWVKIMLFNGAVRASATASITIRGV